MGCGLRLVLRADVFVQMRTLMRDVTQPRLIGKTMTTKQIRNIAIIAHVDHGKTTMVDQLLRQSGTFADHEKVVDTVMDNNAIEKERGITILAKNCAVSWKGTHINILDTPGHADFGGEVERALSMVDGVVLLIDAQEGPMPQTRFVTKKALALGLRPILVVNKVDKPGANPDKVINAAFDLFDKLGATDEQLDFPVVYASGINGWSSLEEGEPGTQWGTDMSALFDTILQHVPSAKGDAGAPLQLQISALDYSTFVGRIGVGRITQGTLKAGQDVLVMTGPDGRSYKGRINQIHQFQGLDRVQVKEARPGELIEAALELFVEKGFAATRVDEVAARAGVSKGTLFLYFPSKEELFKAAVRENIAGRFAEWTLELDAFEGSTDDLLRYCYKVWWERIGNTKTSGITKLMLSEAHHFPEITEFYQCEVMRPGQMLIRRILQRGVDRNEFRPLDMDYAVYLVLAPMIFLTLWKHSMGACVPDALDLDPEKYLAMQADNLLHGLYAAAPSPSPTPL